MCGITGAIGLSTKPAISHELLTALLDKTETRGDDATGFWATSLTTNEQQETVNRVYFSKEPKRSTWFTKDNDVWKSWKNDGVNLVISHCRKRTGANGIETNNINNHPFLSKHGNIALIHNGNVPEIDVLKSKYGVKSDCDSELLLKLIESGFDYEDGYLRETLAHCHVDANRKIKDLTPDEPLPHWASRMMGLRDLFARVNHGAMAVAVSEIWEDNTRALWMFRNVERPLHIVDLRKELGQVFFVSTPEIWRDAVRTSSAKDVVPADKGVIEFPALGIWLITCDTKNNLQCRKWKIRQDRKYNKNFEDERPERAPRVSAVPKIDIVTNVDLETFRVKTPEKATGATNNTSILHETWSDDEAYEGVVCGRLINEPVVLVPLRDDKYQNEREAKESFLAGKEWILKEKKVTRDSFAVGQEIHLKYWITHPPAKFTLPAADQKKKTHPPLLLNQRPPEVQDFPISISPRDAIHLL